MMKRWLEAFGCGVQAVALRVVEQMREPPEDTKQIRGRWRGLVVALAFTLLFMALTFPWEWLQR